MTTLTLRQINDSKAHMGLNVFHREGGSMPPAHFLDANGNPTAERVNAAYRLPNDKFAISTIYPNKSYWQAQFFNVTTGTETGAYLIDPDTTFNLVDAADPINETWRQSRKGNLHRMLRYSGTIGSDPEIFVKDKDGNMVPSFLFLNGKNEPNRTSQLPCYGGGGNQTAYWDGFQAEFTTLAGTCNEVHTDSVAAGLRTIYDAARARFPEARLSLESVYDIPPEMLEAAAEEHVAFGCMPSFNAYGIQVNLPPGRAVPFRSAGGHIHFGVGKYTREMADPVVKGLDSILGVACVSLFANFDSRKRRVFYGLPGEYRLPPHGIEYRPLSNAWLAHPFIMQLVIDFSRKVVVLGQRNLLELWQSDEAETIDTIIRCDAEAARKSLEKNKEVMLQLLSACYKGESYDWADKKDLEILFNIFMNGMESAIADPTDFEKAWYLKGGTAQDTNAPVWMSCARGDKMSVSNGMLYLRAGNKL